MPLVLIFSSAVVCLMVSGANEGSLTDFGQRGDKDPESDDERDLHVVKVDLEDLQPDRLLLVAF